MHSVIVMHRALLKRDHRHRPIDAAHDQDDDDDGDDADDGDGDENDDEDEDGGVEDDGGGEDDEDNFSAFAQPHWPTNI